MTEAKTPSRVATAGAILAIVAWPILVADRFVLLAIIVLTLSLALCGIGIVICLITKRPGVGRAVFGLSVLFALCLAPTPARVRQPAARAHSQNNLKQIVFAFHNYHEQYRCLPSNWRNREGKPLLSWRVMILPYIEEDALFKEFRLDEPWDSNHNLALLPRLPRLYYSFGAQPPEPYMTFVRGFTGPGTAFEREGLSFDNDFPNGLTTTILVIEAGEAVPWTKPDELEYQPEKPLPVLGGAFRATGWLDWRPENRDGFNVAFADGSSRFFPRDNVDEAELRRMISGRLP